MSRRIRIRSDNQQHGEQLAAEDEITICGRVKAWLGMRSA